MTAKDQFQKTLNYLGDLERQFRRFILDGENEKALDLLIQIIEGYRRIGANETVKKLVKEFDILSKRFNIRIEKSPERIQLEKPEEVEKRTLLELIAALEKKVKRRLLQGKISEAISDLNFIIANLRKIGRNDRANLLESTLNQYLLELSNESEELVQKTTEKQLKPIRLPDLRKPKISPPSTPLNITTVSASSSSSSLKIPLKVPLEQESSISPAIPPPPLPNAQRPKEVHSNTSKKVMTLKDLPLTEEEKIVQELFGLKKIMGNDSNSE
ncbi:MAG: hypothetical protein ACTSRS_14240 [Candidatus Helarchaeota archaeon]